MMKDEGRRMKAEGRDRQAAPVFHPSSFILLPFPPGRWFHPSSFIIQHSSTVRLAEVGNEP
jgi:hypothetical protein